MTIRLQDIRTDVFRAGFQDSNLRLIHLPTGITVRRDGPVSYRDRKAALAELERLVEAASLPHHLD